MDEEIQALLWTFGMDIAFFAMCWGVKFVQDRMANTYGHKSTNVPTTINAYDESDEVQSMPPHILYPWPTHTHTLFWIVGHG